jgi:thiosulfate dehydrogenase [quinone] large subunit
MQNMKKLSKMRNIQNNSGQGNWQIISLAVLRISIGWHFLFEGLLKVTNPDWSAAYFLNNAVGPFAPLFKGMAANSVLLGITDLLNEWGLILIGLSLMIGLLSRWACVGGMLLLGLYYLANPPFIGLGDGLMTEGNYLIVNKNLIELFALWVLFKFDDSKVFGMDRFFGLRAESSNE